MRRREESAWLAGRAGARQHPQDRPFGSEPSAVGVHRQIWAGPYSAGQRRTLVLLRDLEWRAIVVLDLALAHSRAQGKLSVFRERDLQVS